jgi:prepilin-type N-terminal cleavage/methylation domain-containing protein
MNRRHAFTLLELLVVASITAILLAIALPLFQNARESGWRAVSTHTLMQLGAAGATYRADHDGEFWRYRERQPDGVAWWFGFEGKDSMRQAEGERMLDLARGPLGPYVIASGGVQADPAFLHEPDRHKPKYKNGNYGYGYNVLLGGGTLGTAAVPRASAFDHPAKLVVFATCAQVNTFQAPASGKHPMIEEFYLIDQKEVTVHFRFGGKALASMLDGSVQELPMDRTTLDRRMPEAQIGRFAPAGSTLYLSNDP